MKGENGNFKGRQQSAFGCDAEKCELVTPILKYEGH